MTQDTPGLYCARPISSVSQGVITSDARHAATCARVNNLNLKFGKAERSLRSRENNYQKDFPGNIRFTPLVVFADGATARKAESLIKPMLKPFRMRSPKGRRLEWMAGIDETRLREIVYGKLDEAGITYTRPSSGA